MLKPARDRVDDLYEALDAEQLELALEIAEELEPRAKEPAIGLAILSTFIHAELWEGAHRLATRLSQLGFGGQDETTRRWYQAVAAYSLGEPREGVDLLQHLNSTDPLVAAEFRWREGLCHDHLGEENRANSCFQQAVGLAPETFTSPIEATPEEIEQIVERSALELPAELRQLFQQVPVVIESLPPLKIVRRTRGNLHPDTLGLYVGTDLTQMRQFEGIDLPSAIYIYRRNLERFVTTRAELEREVRITLFHELGHHLGLDEDAVGKLGLE